MLQNLNARRGCWTSYWILVVFLSVSFAPISCGDDIEDDSQNWKIDQSKLTGALTAVWGTSEDDVWAVGADRRNGTGPTVMHFDGSDWVQLFTGAKGDLWWVFGFEGGPVFMGGKDGLILRYEEGEFDLMDTPGLGTVYGIWGTTPDNLWAVGGQLPAGAFAWRYEGDYWKEVEGFPSSISANQSLFKVWGRSIDDVWMVGTGGVILHSDGLSFNEEKSGTSSMLFTVFGDEESLFAVGGLGAGVILSKGNDGWQDVTPGQTPHLMGVWVDRGSGYAVGVNGAVARLRDHEWELIETGLGIPEALHAVWQDPAGRVWAVGGQVLAPPLIDGVIIHRDVTDGTE